MRAALVGRAPPTRVGPFPPHRQPQREGIRLSCERRTPGDHEHGRRLLRQSQAPVERHAPSHEQEAPRALPGRARSQLQQSRHDGHRTHGGRDWQHRRGPRQALQGDGRQGRFALRPQGERAPGLLQGGGAGGRPRGAPQAEEQAPGEIWGRLRRMRRRPVRVQGGALRSGEAEGTE